MALCQCITFNAIFHWSYWFILFLWSLFLPPDHPPQPPVTWWRDLMTDQPAPKPYPTAPFATWRVARTLAWHRPTVTRACQVSRTQGVCRLPPAALRIHSRWQGARTASSPAPIQWGHCRKTGQCCPPYPQAKQRRKEIMNFLRKFDFMNYSVHYLSEPVLSKVVK